ncbi:MAG: hypothetical protein KGH75_01350 [Rhodospirillales bacterium]|nr:hypothetical protein [Rhodospirillales bacterium]
MITRTLLHPSDSDGCGYYRIVQPGTALANHTNQHFIISHTYYMINHIKDKCIDRVICQRHTEEHMVANLKFYKDLNLKIVHDLDDLLWQVPPSNNYHKYFKGTNKKCLREALSIADKLVVSTEPLAQEVKKFTKRESTVLPNMILSKHYQLPKSRTKQKLRVGWAGSNTHAGDLRIISPVIQNTLDKYEWVFMGYAEPQWKEKVEFHQFVPVSEYTDKLKSLNLDVMLIPLEENAFNNSKSHIKLLEAASIGVPATTTDIDPYKENPNPKIPTSNKSWKKFVDVLAAYEDETVRLEAAHKAFDWAKKYCVELNIPKIDQAWSV